MGPERDVEPLLVPVERVRVLHHELAHAQEAAAGTRLVPVFRLEVVEDLRQVAVRAQLARVERDRLLVRQRQDEPTARCGPRRGTARGCGCRPVASHSSAGVSTGIDISCPPIASISSRITRTTFSWIAPARRQERPEPGAELTDQTCADEQLVRDSLGVGRVLAERRQEEDGLALEHAPNPSRAQSFSRRNPVRVVVSPPRAASRTNASSFWIASRSSAESASPARPSTIGSSPSTST